MCTLWAARSGGVDAKFCRPGQEAADGKRGGCGMGRPTRAMNL
jgi:hypothetical protein